MTCSTDELDRLIADATVDCYDDSEGAGGFHAMIEENVAFPFDTTVLGVQVTVEGIDFVGDFEIVAICARGGQRQRIRLADLPLPTPTPAGVEWIAAYRKWAGTF